MSLGGSDGCLLAMRATCGKMAQDVAVTVMSILLRKLVMRKPVAMALVALLFVASNILSLAGGLSAGWYLRRPTAATALPSSAPEMSPVPEEGRLKIFLEAWQFIDQEFFSEQPLDDQKINYEAIRGVIKALGDPYTTFMEPPQRSLERSSYEGKFGGIGAVLSMNDKNEPFISQVMNGAPAEAAGLQAGDILLAADEKAFAGLSLDQVVLQIRGPIGTIVILLVRREGREQTFAITRAEIKQPTVSWEAVDAGRIAHIELTFFAEPTGAELSTALSEIRQAGIKEIILDLRGNRGGLLNVAGEVTSKFVKQGVLVYERNYDEKGQIVENPYMIPRSNLIFDSEPLAVLVDKGTASASEIVAGAIQDYQRGTLVGETTFGKGSVQYLHELSDQSSLHVTASNWLTPQKRPIHGIGLTPDIEAKRSEEDIRAGRDPQLDRAIAALTEKRK
jgi:carboxyl-terminal processing protease